MPCGSRSWKASSAATSIRPGPSAGAVGAVSSSRPGRSRLPWTAVDDTSTARSGGSASASSARAMPVDVRRAVGLLRARAGGERDDHEAGAYVGQVGRLAASGRPPGRRAVPAPSLRCGAGPARRGRGRRDAGPTSAPRSPAPTRRTSALITAPSRPSPSRVLKELVDLRGRRGRLRAAAGHLDRGGRVGPPAPLHPRRAGGALRPAGHRCGCRPRRWCRAASAGTRHVRRLRPDVHRAAAGPVADDGDGVAAQQRGDGRGEPGQVRRAAPARRAQQVLGLLGVARPDVGDLEHRGAHVGRQVGEGRAGVEHDDARRGRSVGSQASSGSRVRSRASEKPVTQTRSPARGADVASDSTLISRSAPRVVTKVRSALGSTITTQMPVSRSGTGGGGGGDALRARAPARIRSPWGPVPMAPACTQSAPKRAAATSTVTAPPA